MKAIGLLAAGLVALMAPARTAAQAWTESSKVVSDLEAGRCGKAVDRVNAGLKEGEPAAYYFVGTMHLRGLCVPKAPEKARAYLEPAARAGYYGAARLLIEMYGRGVGVPQSYAEAGRWAVAMLDISGALRPAASAPASGQSAPKENIPVDKAIFMGVLGTVRSLVQERMEHPFESYRTFDAARETDVEVTMTLSAEGLSYAVRAAHGGGSPRPSAAQVEALQKLLDEIVKELAPAPAVSDTFTGNFKVAFRLR